MCCSGEEGHPQYQEGSALDPMFVDRELLFRRFRKDHLKDGRVLPSAFRFPRQSFIRAKYSVPEDVLHPDCCDGKDLRHWGVLECSSTELPTPLISGDQRSFIFAAVHAPLECCYAHTEIRCECDGSDVIEPSKKVQEEFKVKLSLRAQILIDASV
jgi:hypothetical protein